MESFAFAMLCVQIILLAVWNRDLAGRIRKLDERLATIEKGDES